MTPSDFIDRVTEYFSGNYKPAHVARITEFLERIDGSAIEAIFDRLIEDCSPRFSIGVKEIVDACNVLGIGYRRTHYVPARDWECHCCGHTFKYAQAVTEDDKIDKGIYDYCPKCGAQPGWKMLEDGYRSMGLNTDWYDRQMMICAGYGPDKDKVKVRIATGMSWLRGGVFWDRSEAEEERRQNKTVNIASRLSQLDREKKWR
jgi:hypothetical protein